MRKVFGNIPTIPFIVFIILAAGLLVFSSDITGRVTNSLDLLYSVYAPGSVLEGTTSLAFSANDLIPEDATLTVMVLTPPECNYSYMCGDADETAVQSQIFDLDTGDCVELTATPWDYCPPAESYTEYNCTEMGKECCVYGIGTSYFNLKGCYAEEICWDECALISSLSLPEAIALSNNAGKGNYTYGRFMNNGNTTPFRNAAGYGFTACSETGSPTGSAIITTGKVAFGAAISPDFIILKPDLAIKEINLDSNKLTNIIIENKGTASSPTFKLSVSWQQTTTCPVQSFDQTAVVNGATALVTAPFQAAKTPTVGILRTCIWTFNVPAIGAGSEKTISLGSGFEGKTITVTVDSTNIVAESNEANNVKTKTLISQADLTVKNIYLENSRIAYATFENIGAASSYKSCKLSVSWQQTTTCPVQSFDQTAVMNGATALVTAPFQAMQPTQALMRTCTWTFNVPAIGADSEKTISLGSGFEGKTITATIDSTNIIAESNEANNAKKTGPLVLKPDLDIDNIDSVYLDDNNAYVSILSLGAPTQACQLSVTWSQTGACPTKPSSQTAIAVRKGVTAFVPVPFQAAKTPTTGILRPCTWTYNIPALQADTVFNLGGGLAEKTVTVRIDSANIIDEGNEDNNLWFGKLTAKECEIDANCVPKIMCFMMAGMDTPKCNPLTWTCYCGGVCGDGVCDEYEAMATEQKYAPGECLDDCARCDIIEGVCYDDSGAHYPYCSYNSAVPYYCDQNKECKPRLVSIECSEGTVCYDGECVDETCTAAEGTCIAEAYTCPDDYPKNDTGKQCGEGMKCCVPATKCTDPDGKNYFEKGTCSDATGSYLDKCKEGWMGISTQVDEWYCGPDNKCTKTTYTCPSSPLGLGICSRGSCKGFCIKLLSTCKDHFGTYTDKCEGDYSVKWDCTAEIECGKTTTYCTYGCDESTGDCISAPQVENASVSLVSPADGENFTAPASITFYWKPKEFTNPNPICIPRTGSNLTDVVYPGYPDDPDDLTWINCKNNELCNWTSPLLTVSDTYFWAVFCANNKTGAGINASIESPFWYFNIEGVALANYTCPWNNVYEINLSDLSNIEAPKYEGPYYIFSYLAFNISPLSYDLLLFNVSSEVPGEKWINITAWGPCMTDGTQTRTMMEIYSQTTVNETGFCEYLGPLGLVQITTWAPYPCEGRNQSALFQYSNGTYLNQSRPCCTENWSVVWGDCNATTKEESGVWTEMNKCDTTYTKPDPATTTRTCIPPGVTWQSLIIWILIVAVVIIVIIVASLYAVKRTRMRAAKIIKETAKPAAGAAAAALAVKPAAKPAPKKEYPALKNYIAKAKAKGMTKEKIRQELLKSGWPANIIDQVLTK